MGVKAPKEVQDFRPDSTVDWYPEVLQDWMNEQGEVSLTWLSETIGKNKFYLYKCMQRKRIGRLALVNLQDITGIPKSFFMGNKPLPKEEETEVRKNDVFAEIEQKTEEPQLTTTMKPMQGTPPKRTLPKGWIAVSGVDFYQFVRADDIIQVRQLMNGTRVITNHGAFDVIDQAHTIMERMAEC